MSAVSIDSIIVGTRHRRDLGDIAGLAESMTELGQLQPIVVTPDNHLIAGERRLAAARSLGWTEIDVHVVRNLDDAGRLAAERDENTCRRQFSPTEAEEIAAAIEAVLKPLAALRQTQAPGEPRGVKLSAGKLPAETSQRPRDIAPEPP